MSAFENRADREYERNKNEPPDIPANDQDDSWLDEEEEVRREVAKQGFHPQRADRPWQRED